MITPPDIIQSILNCIFGAALGSVMARVSTLGKKYTESLNLMSRVIDNNEKMLTILFPKPVPTISIEEAFSESLKVTEEEVHLDDPA